jgi:hypothetical protein
MEFVILVDLIALVYAGNHIDDFILFSFSRLFVFHYFCSLKIQYFNENDSDYSGWRQWHTVWRRVAQAVPQSQGAAHLDAHHPGLRG